MDAWTYLFMHSGSSSERVAYQHPKLDALVEAQRKELDAGKRKAIWKQIWDMELDQVYRPAVTSERAIGHHSPKLHNALANQAHLWPTYGNAMSEIVWVG